MDDSCDGASVAPLGVTEFPDDKDVLELTRVDTDRIAGAFTAEMSLSASGGVPGAAVFDGVFETAPCVLPPLDGGSPALLDPTSPSRCIE